jgi:hypothetical protein
VIGKFWSTQNDEPAAGEDGHAPFALTADFIQWFLLFAPLDLPFQID